MGGDPKYMEAVCKGGKFNGEIPTQKGNKTFPNQEHKELDKSRIGSKVGVMKNGK